MRNNTSYCRQCGSEQIELPKEGSTLRGIIVAIDGHNIFLETNSKLDALKEVVKRMQISGEFVDATHISLIRVIKEWK